MITSIRRASAMGTLMQMHHDLGMVVAYTVAAALFGIIAVGARRAIPA